MFIIIKVLFVFIIAAIDIVIFFNKPNTNPAYTITFPGELPQTEIGRVHVEDADDWDGSDKIYRWLNEKPQYFDIDGTGTLFIEQGVPEGDYNFEVKISGFVFVVIISL